MDLATVTGYRLPTTREDLVLAPGERFLGGGTWLYSEPQPSTTGLVDLTALGWPDAEPLADGGLRISATCTVDRLQQLDWPPATARLARQAADAFLMSFKIQYAATVGGNLALGLPAGAMISLMSALAGEAVIWTTNNTEGGHGPGERRESVVDLVTGVGTTTLRPGEVIRAVDLPGWAVHAPTALRRISLTEYGRSSAVVIGRRDADSLAITVTAATPRPRVLTLPLAPSVAEVRSAVADIGALTEGGAGWHDDAHGASDWRAAVTAELAVQVAEELS